jgi:3-oxoadipate enol-lactonase/4-carboxymuconolactone decarboxylase
MTPPTDPPPERPARRFLRGRGRGKGEEGARPGLAPPLPGAEGPAPTAPDATAPAEEPQAPKPRGPRLRYELAGPEGAPVLVLAASLGTSMAMWDDQVEALGQRFRVLRYDHRGHGRSEVPAGPYSIAELGADLVGLLDALGLERVHLAGLSLGGMVAMWVAANAPGRIDRLALLCTSARIEPASIYTERAAKVRASGTASVADEVVARWFTPGFPVSWPPLAARAVGMLAATPDEGYAGCCEAIAAMDLRAELGSIRAPTLVVAGDRDQATPAEHTDLLASSIPGARLAVVKGAAHLATMEQPEAVTQLLLDHFRRGRQAKVKPRPPGITVRREVLGDEHVDRALAATTDFTADFQELITRYAWGEVWARPGLDRRTRSAVTLAMLATLAHDEELEMHVRSALGNGLSADEIKEVLLQVAVYAGVPAANRAFRIAQRVLDEDT